MSSGVERCPHCVTLALAERTNGIGHVYLECPCGYVEVVTRRADPHPSRIRLTLTRDGRQQKRYLVTQMSRIGRKS